MSNVNDESSHCRAAIKGHQGLLCKIQSRNIKVLEKDLCDSLVLLFCPVCGNDHQHRRRVPGSLNPELSKQNMAPITIKIFPLVFTSQFPLTPMSSIKKLGPVQSD